MSIIAIGIDLAKNIFAVHGVNENGHAELVKPKVSRDQLLPLIANFPPCLMSRKGNCWERVAYPWGATPMERFFGTLKTESLHQYRFATREQARQTVFEYIEVFYNRIRCHAKIANQIPTDFAKQFYADSQMAA